MAEVAPQPAPGAPPRRRSTMNNAPPEVATVDSDPWRLAAFGILDILRRWVEIAVVAIAGKRPTGMLVVLVTVSFRYSCATGLGLMNHCFIS